MQFLQDGVLPFLIIWELFAKCDSVYKKGMVLIGLLYIICGVVFISFQPLKKVEPNPPLEKVEPNIVFHL